MQAKTGDKRDSPAHLSGRVWKTICRLSLRGTPLGSAQDGWGPLAAGEGPAPQALFHNTMTAAPDWYYAMFFRLPRKGREKRQSESRYNSRFAAIIPQRSGFARGFRLWAPSGRELSPQVTEGELGRLSHRLVQSVDLPRTSRSPRCSPPIATKPFGPCDNLPPTRLTPGHLPPRGRRLGYHRPAPQRVCLFSHLVVQCPLDCAGHFPAPEKGVTT